jgi:hypothetical protein
MLTHKIDTLIALTTFFKKCEKCKRDLDIGTDGVYLQEMTRTMIHETNMAKHLWAEAINRECYVRNRIYILLILNKTPYKLFKGRRLIITYFH